MRATSLTLTLLTVLPLAPSWGEDRPAGPPAPASREPASRTEEKPKPHVSAGENGFALQSADGAYRLQLRGYTHFDGRFFSGDEQGVATDTFLLRRVRPILQGSLGRHVDFSLMTDFGGGNAVLQDAWLDFAPWSAFKVRVGKFKSPVGLERLQSATAIHFVERAFPSALVPNRDLGIQLHGELAGGVVAWAAAILDGAPDGGSVDTDTNDGKDLAGRVFVSPFRTGRTALKGLGFGLSGTTGEQTGALPSYRSAGQIGVVSPISGVVADGKRQRTSPQLSFYAGRFGLLAEYVRSRSKVKRSATAAQQDFDTSAWQATATFALTGDTTSYGGLRPARPFDPAKGQWGALELAVRVHRLRVAPETVDAGLVDPSRSVRQMDAWAVGLNWSLNRNLRQVVDFEHVGFTGGAAAGADRDAENILFVRTQLSF